MMNAMEVIEKVAI